MHVASAGGVWSALVFGFAGMGDRNGRLSLRPAPAGGLDAAALPGRLARLAAAASSSTQDELRDHACSRSARPRCACASRGEPHTFTRRASRSRVALDGQGPRIDGLLGDKPQVGGTRADGTKITAGVPEPMMFDEDPPTTDLGAIPTNEGL